jgi:hypothetical protein
MGNWQGVDMPFMVEINSCFKSVTIDQDFVTFLILNGFGVCAKERINLIIIECTSFNNHTTVSYSATYVNNDLLIYFQQQMLELILLEKV